MLTRNDHYKLRVISNTYILVASRKTLNEKWMYVLNEIGAFIWQNCHCCCNVDKIINDIENKFHIILNNEQIDSVNFFVKQLISMGLIKEL
jgi:hypothetical protein